jgi:hypothetical protein
MSRPSDELHKETLQEIRTGHRIQVWVAGKIVELGFPVRVPELSLRKDPSFNKFNDGGDIWVCNELVEVKSTRYPFSSLDDFKFDKPMIDTVSGWDSKKIKPVTLIEVCRLNGAMIFLPIADTRDAWTVVSKHDHRKGYDDRFYACPKMLWKNFGQFRPWFYERILNLKIQ